MLPLTPDQTRKVGVGLIPSPSPFLTPRPEKRHRETRGPEWSSIRQLDKDREVNVQVLLRCRPLNDEELRLNVPKAITCNEHRREVTVSQTVANKSLDRVFTFDKVFGPKAQQRSIYEQAIVPIVNEVLEGFNCTVFAYGQTGTGKTYTMEGGMRNKTGELPAEAGVIPRAVRQIFEALEAQNADYSMKVTFLEIYNEEITDLLAPDDNPRSFEEKQKKIIPLMEDGKGCVIVRGLEEESVYSANDIYNLLERGSSKRRTADTLLNKRSSRSHSVFTITIYVKETNIGNEELIKCGKLNLVDLAGSENISRSGAREGRAREAGEINKSLLTLGRVINALVEHSVHVPYRDSKLTRLLRDSLGGKTKTCIIATVSPSPHCLEETLSTLEYACRAKNIKNKPEANQKMSKAVLLKDLYAELERMKQDVRAARERNGVYIPHERFMQDEAEKKAKNEKIEQLEIDLGKSETEAHKFHELYLREQDTKISLESELKNCKIDLEINGKALIDLKERYNLAISMIKEKELMILKLQNSESCLVKCAKELRDNLRNASDDINALFTKIDQKNILETKNQGLLCKFGSELDQSLKDLHKTILGSVFQQQQQMQSVQEHLNSFLASKSDATRAIELRIEKMTGTYAVGIEALKGLSKTLNLKASADLEQMKSTILSQMTEVENFLVIAVSEAKDVVCNIKNSLCEQRELLAFAAKQQQEVLHRNLVSAQNISSSTTKFLNDLNQGALKLMEILQEYQSSNSYQVSSFEKMFKEEAIREEESAMKEISIILARLTAKKTAFVTEASRNINKTSTNGSNAMLQELTNMQQVSVNAKKDLNGYMKNIESHYFEDAFQSSEIMASIESCLQECAKEVDNSKQKWEMAQSHICNHHKSSISDLDSSNNKRFSANEAGYKEFVSICASMLAESRSQACNLQNGLDDGLTLDKDTKTKMDSISTICLNELNLMRDNHGQAISNIHDSAEHCLKKEYLVDRSMTPKKRAIPIPSLESIEEMRARVSNGVTVDKKQKLSYTESKIQQNQFLLSPDRTPFADVN